MSISVQFVSSAPFEAGAARAAFRLHESLAEQGVNSGWLDAGGTATPTRSDLIVWPRPKKRSRSLWTRLKGHGDELNYKRLFAGTTTYVTWPEGWGKASRFELLPTPDLWHLHWMGEFLDWPTALPAMAQRAPIVWTLHDLNPTQGVWHYDPQTEELNANRNELDIRAREIKRGALSAVPPSRLIFAAPSRWIADRCSASELTSRYEVVHIPNGVNTDFFHPVDKDVAKASLCLSPAARVVGFVAHHLSDPRKGMLILQEALERLLLPQPIILLTLGSRGIGSQLELAAASLVSLGPVYDERLLRLFYSACDLFVCPSLQDNLPNTVLEAMACGTPVVASETGGITDMIREGETGWMAHPGDAEALAALLSRVLVNQVCLTEAGHRARTRVLKEFTLRLQAERYADLYQRIACT